MTPTEALQNRNVQAFLHMLRHGEGTSDPEGYRRLFGGKLFDNGYADHPRQVQTYSLKGQPLSSSAAGAYQILQRTWDGLVRQYGFTDFSPATQDAAAVALIIGRKALDDVLAGRFEAAVAKCNREWASLPGSPYGQPTVTLDAARAVYLLHGGEFSTVQTSVPPSIAPQTNPTHQEKPVAPFILAALPALFEAVPKLINIFGSGSEVAKRNEAAVQMAVDIAKTAVGAPNEQALVETLQNDPEAARVVRQAMEENWFQLVEVGGGIEAARKANEVYLQPGTKGFWHNPAFVISCLLLAMPFMLLADMFYVHPALYVGEIRTQVITGLLAVIMMVGGYWIGTSFSSSKKDERQAG